MAIVMDDLNKLSKDDLIKFINLFNDELEYRKKLEIEIKVSTCNDLHVYDINGYSCIFIYVVDGVMPICLKDMSRYCEPLKHVSGVIKIKDIDLNNPVEIKFVKSIPRAKYLNTMNDLLVNG